MSKHILILLIFTVVLGLPFSVQAGDRQATKKNPLGQSHPTAAAKPQATVLFAVQETEWFGKHLYLADPVVFIDEKGRFSHPFNASNSSYPTAAVATYFKTYGRVGSAYRLLRAGSESDSIVVRKQLRDTGNLHLQVSPPKTGIEGFALATNSQTFGQSPLVRRQATVEEKREAEKLAHRALAKQGVSEDQFSKLKLVHLVATDFDGDGGDDLIGDYEIAQPDESLPATALFLMLRKSKTGYEVSFEQFFDFQKQTDGQTNWRFTLVGLLDLDTDRQPEVILTNDQGVTLTYVILKKEGSTWKEIYNGGGYGLVGDFED